MNRDTQLLRILGIGHDTSMRGAGISLREALTLACYEELRPGFGAQDLLPLIQEHPTLVEEWVAYSEDKRTDGGWYLLNLEVGRVTSNEKFSFDSVEEAVANYVVRELDFWVSVRRAA